MHVCPTNSLSDSYVSQDYKNQHSRSLSKPTNGYTEEFVMSCSSSYQRLDAEHTDIYMFAKKYNSISNSD